MENITLDPEYENLIIEVNKLKDKVAEKIAERDKLAFHIIPDIESKYMNKIGVLENDAFIANLKLLRANRKLELYKEKIKLKRPIDEKEIEEQLDVEFDEIEDEYNELQEEAFLDLEDEFTDNQDVVYKELIPFYIKTKEFKNGVISKKILLSKLWFFYDLSENAYVDINIIADNGKKTKLLKNALPPGENMTEVVQVPADMQNVNGYTFEISGKGDFRLRAMERVDRTNPR